ncbi:hypothetical protein TREMEDRAFT_67578 [Tremella mesenterica DSM 1558]|uniref:uncharacterized protein n=1 Tax=Tremella mesenterica (strain ATCC 24925 / CBS 8224 / DSM 1558 / NBRC 9311 / NRRL Y-6157 / RJB 2259-6 / UBC 559-6) TaxID=578456 RepID=UPI0003F497DD|nr:uncharacterized protein TREMEDRAFT_67578 [Tremella mesenterica DSM 1558]EIW71118.1 hypothetical protein TREMEDRAFT_67578 [Tremella mesenterica DSM 1558]
MSPELTPLASALAGALGAVFSNALVYPLDTIKTRLQALPPQPKPFSSSTEDTVRHDAHGVIRRLSKRLKRWQLLQMLIQVIGTEGIGGVFKGFSANMINTFSQQFAYFFFHTFLRSWTLRKLRSSPTSHSHPPTLGTSSELLIGAAAGALAQIFTIPVAVIATRQQLWTPPLTNPSRSISTNNSSPLTTTSSPNQETETPSLLEHEKEASFSSDTSLFQVAQEIIAEGGFTALWTGLRPGLVLTVNPAITYGVFERLKTYLLSAKPREGEGGKLNVGEAFWLGVGSKTLATVVTYPYIFAKVKLQAQTSKGDLTISTPKRDTDPSDIISETKVTFTNKSRTPASVHKSTGALDILRHVYKKEGMKGWYRGLGAQILKAVLCQGILFVSKDQFEVYAIMILALLSRLKNRIVIK